MKKALSFLLRIDNLNRILVLLSLGLFLVLPCQILYLLDESTQTLDVLLPCIVFLGVIIGNSVITFVRPIRTTFVYFLELLFSIAILFYDYPINKILVNINYKAIIWLEIVFCIIAVLINLIVTVRFLKKKRGNGASKEDTNEDTIYDFLNASSSNEKIEGDIENIMDEKDKNRMKNKKQVKFSRAIRIFSFAVTFITLFVYFISVASKENETYFLPFYELLLLSLILILMVFIGALRYPRDFKYLYFYNSAFFLLLAIITAKEYAMNIIFLIIAMVVLGLSFLIALIVEGRTWMGSKSD